MGNRQKRKTSVVNTFLTFKWHTKKKNVKDKRWKQNSKQLQG